MHVEDQGRIEATMASRAAQSPGSLAVLDGEREWSYRALAAMIAASSERLLAHGVNAGDRVLIFLDKSIESVVALHAVVTVGGIAVPAHEGLRSRPVRHLL